MPSFAEPRRILITGASSGLGAALAQAYAAPGASLVLGGRDGDRLAAVGTVCEGLGATVERAVVDVTDAAAMAAWVTEADAARPLDLVIANAGRSGGTGAGAEPDEQTRAILATNLNGVVEHRAAGAAGHAGAGAGPDRGHGLAGRIPGLSRRAGLLRQQGGGEDLGGIAARLAGGRGRGGLRHLPRLRPHPMTAVNRFPMPFLMDAHRAAEVIRKGLARNRGRIAFPWPMALGAWLVGAMPDALADRLTRRLPRKG